MKDRFEAFPDAEKFRVGSKAREQGATKGAQEDAMSNDEAQNQPAEPRSLYDLPVDVAIRLRWVLRDIRAGRIKVLAPSSDDLTLLAERGLISMNNDNLVLTDGGEFEIGSPA